METTINERTNSILVEKGLNYSEFARAINVHANNVRQVCKGDNKPSYEFIAAVLKAFPEIDALWYVIGIGEKQRDIKSKNTDLVEQLKRENERLVVDKEELRMDKQRLYRIIEHNGLMGSSNFNFVSGVPPVAKSEFWSIFAPKFVYSANSLANN